MILEKLRNSRPIRSPSSAGFCCFERPAAEADREMGVEQSCCVKRGGDKEDVGGVTKTISRNIQGTPYEKMAQKGGGNPVPALQEKVGVGVYFSASANETGTLIVKSIIKGSPAFKSNKISVGDTIISVNGTSVVGKNLAGLADLLLGKPGTEVKLTFKSASVGDKFDVDLVRGITA